VLYASCPAIEDLPRAEAPTARRVTGGAVEFARALAEVRASAGPGPGPRTVPGAARHYCVTRSAARLLDVYATALTHPLPPPPPSPSPSSPEPPPVSTSPAPQGGSSA
ncbi:glycosyl transferase, partial [Streptomyces olivaceus]